MKKTVSALLAVVMLIGSLTVAIGAQKYICDNTFALGNADRDEIGAVNAKDLNVMKSYLLGNEGAIASVDTVAADLEADGKINVNDIFYIKQLMSGNITLQELGDNKQTAVFEIAGVDISLFAIVVPYGADRTKNCYYAAEELNQYIRAAVGVSLPIINDGMWTGPAVNIYQYDRKSEMGQTLGAEGYKYSVDENGNLNIHGTYRGCMYAVYEILEDYLGIRFFDGVETFIYKNRYVNIPDSLDVSVTPKMKFRYCGQNVGRKEVGGTIENYYYPSRQNGTQIYGYGDEKYGYQYGPQNINAHSFDMYWLMGTGEMPEDDGTMTLEERYVHCYNTGETVGQFAWQPCGTGEESYQTLLLGMLRHMDRINNWGYNFTTTAADQVLDGQKTMSFSLCDNTYYCTCRYCKNMANGWTDRTQKPPVKHPAEGYAGVYLAMANRAVNDIQEYYPGMRVHMILYDKTVPATVRPDEKIVLMYCGLSCQNHYINSDECINYGQLSNNKTNNKDEVKTIKAWGDICKESGAELWYWNYAVSYHYYLAGLPCLYNIYYDYKYLYEECNVRGIYYEGGGKDYIFETLKAYMNTKMAWEPDMSFEQFESYVKEYLYMYYGDGSEFIYAYLQMYEQSGDECGTCFISNFDRPGDYHSYEYFALHYEEMRELLQNAYDMADNDTRRMRIKTLSIGMEFMALSSVHQSWYVEGDESTKALYEERYTAFYNDLKASGMQVYSSAEGIDDWYRVPATCDFETNPMIQIYELGSRRQKVYP